MFEQFTDDARRVVARAQEEARILHHDAIGTEHLLLGLLHDEDVAQRALASRLSLEEAREQVAALAPRGEAQPAGHIPFTPEGRRALERSVAEAEEGGRQEVDTAHLLLGLVHDAEGLAHRILEQAGVDLEGARRQAVALAAETRPSSGIRSWVGMEPMSRRVAQARARARAEGDPVRENDPGAWEMLGRGSTSTLRAFGVARRHAISGLRGELATIDLVVGVLAVGDPAVRDALAEAGADDPSPARLIPGHPEGEALEDVIGMSGNARRSCGMAVRLVGDEAGLATPAHVLLAAIEALGPLRAGAAAARLGADDVALRQALLRRIVRPPPPEPRPPEVDAGAMLDRFTDRARRVLVFAQEEAARLGHGHVGTEHLLLGLVHEEEGVAAQALESLGVSLDDVRARVEDMVEAAGGDARDDRIGFTPRAKTVLELSLREALQLGHRYIGTEHVLLGLVREGEGVAARVLSELGTDLADVRTRVLQALSGHPGDPAEWMEPGGAWQGWQEVGWALLAGGSESVWRAVGLARQQAAVDGHTAIQVRDLLLGALGTGDPRVTAALTAAGADAASVTRAALFGPGDDEPPPRPWSPPARTACVEALRLAGDGAVVVGPTHLLLGCLHVLDTETVEAVGTRVGVDLERLATYLPRDAA